MDLIFSNVLTEDDIIFVFVRSSRALAERFARFDETKEMAAIGPYRPPDSDLICFRYAFMAGSRLLLCAPETISICSIGFLPDASI